MRDVLFKEEQRFRQPWIWLLLVGMVVLLVVTFGRGLYVQLVVGEPWGARPMGDTALAASAGTAFSITLALFLLFVFAKLTTEVRRDGVFVRFFPFHLHGVFVPYSEIVECEARKYRPIVEYGGWGIRFGRAGKAYNVSGDRGVQLVLKGGKRLLIGSQRADELANAIEKALARSP